MLRKIFKNIVRMVENVANSAPTNMDTHLSIPLKSGSCKFAVYQNKHISSLFINTINTCSLHSCNLVIIQIRVINYFHVLVKIKCTRFITYIVEPISKYVLYKSRLSDDK